MSSVQVHSTPRSPSFLRKWTGFAAVGLLCGVSALGIWYLGSDIFAGFTADAPVVSGLPVDAPAASLARVNDQTAKNSAGRSAAPADEVLELQDFTYTQFSSTPFLFNGPNGFDFFNSLFVFLSGQQNQQQQGFNGFSPFGFQGGSFGGGGGSSGPVFGGFPFLATNSPASNSNFPTNVNGGMFLTISFSQVIIPISFSNQGVFNAHAYAPTIAVVNVLSVNPISAID